MQAKKMLAMLAKMTGDGEKLAMQLGSLGAADTLKQQLEAAVQAARNHYLNISRADGKGKFDKNSGANSFDTYSELGTKVMNYYSDKKALANALVSASNRQANPKAPKDAEED